MVTSRNQSNGRPSAQRLLLLLGVVLLGIGGWHVVCSGIAWSQDADPANAPDAEAPSGDTGGAAADPKDSFERLPVNESAKKKPAVNPMLSAGRFATPAEKETFDKYYKEYLFPRWTEPKNLSGTSATSNVHVELRSDLRRAKGEVHDHLIQITLEFMNSLLAGPYHPASQVNAVLMIGELNSVESIGNEAAKPHPDMLQPLLAIVDSERSNDALRAAAIVGILRHIEGKIDNGDARKAVATALLKQAASEISTGPEGAGRSWIRGQAILGLGLLGTVGDNNEVVKTILKAVSDGSLSFSSRCLAATALGRLDYAAAEGIDLDEAIGSLCHFIVETCPDDVRLTKANDRRVFRRRMKECLHAVAIAINGDGAGHKGIGALAKEKRAERLGELTKLIKAMLDTTLDDKDLGEDDLQKEAESFRNNVQEWLKK